MATTVRVTREFYRVAKTEFDDLGAAVRFAFGEAVRGNYHYLDIERVTQHEPVEWGVFPVTETVTGRRSIAGPASFFGDPELSRYQPVNGWVIPDTIDVETV